jgi:hypothetical protein
VRTPFYGREPVAQTVSAAMFVGLCVYFWRRSQSRSEEGE